jgi:hypothetical protein
MTLPVNLNDREQQKFEEVAGQVTVRTKVVSGTITAAYAPSGLRNSGRLSFVTLNSTSWTALPATPLPDRNGISIQNQSNVEIRIQYENTDPLYRGVKLSPDAERFYDIKDTIIVYAKAASGTPEILVEEIS